MYVQLIQCPVDNCTDDEEEDEKNALYLMVSLMLRGDPEENLRMVYEEHQVRKTNYYYGDLKYYYVSSYRLPTILVLSLVGEKLLLPSLHHSRMWMVQMSIL